MASLNFIFKQIFIIGALLLILSDATLANTGLKIIIQEEDDLKSPIKCLNLFQICKQHSDCCSGFCDPGNIGPWEPFRRSCAPYPWGTTV